MRKWILSFGKGIVFWLSVFFLGFLSVVSLFSSTYFDRNNLQAEHPLYRMDNVVFNIFIILLFFCVLFWINKKYDLENIHTKILAAAAVIFVVTVSVIWVSVSNTIPRADQAEISLSALLVSIDKYLYFQPLYYIQRCPHQLGMTAISIASAVLVKSNYSIFLIALILLIMYKALEQKNVKTAALAFLMVFTVSLMNKGLTAFYEYRSGTEISSGIPMLLYVAMGMQEGDKAEGWYNNFNGSTYMDTEGDIEECNLIAKEAIRTSLEKFRGGVRLCPSILL